MQLTVSEYRQFPGITGVELRVHRSERMMGALMDCCCRSCVSVAAEPDLQRRDHHLQESDICGRPVTSRWRHRDVWCDRSCRHMIYLLLLYLWAQSFPIKSYGHLSHHFSPLLHLFILFPFLLLSPFISFFLFFIFPFFLYHSSSFLIPCSKAAP